MLACLLACPLFGFLPLTWFRTLLCLEQQFPTQRLWSPGDWLTFSRELSKNIENHRYLHMIHSSYRVAMEIIWLEVTPMWGTVLKGDGVRNDVAHSGARSSHISLSTPAPAPPPHTCRHSYRLAWYRQFLFEMPFPCDSSVCQVDS